VPTAAAAPRQIKMGPGLVYVGAEGATDLDTLANPLTSAIPADYIFLGFTKEGSVIKYQQEIARFTPAERTRPAKAVRQSTGTTFEVAAVEMTLTNLQRALNGGVITNPAGQVFRFDPPQDQDALTFASLLWVGEDNLERALFRKALQEGEVERKNDRSDDAASLPMMFQCYDPGSGKRDFTWYSEHE
jgi:hypothetical protein